MRREAGRVFGRQRLIGAASGFAQTGQLLEIADQSMMELDRDTAINRFNADQEAEAIRFGAETTRFTGEQLRDASRIGAAGTLLGSAGGLVGSGLLARG